MDPHRHVLPPPIALATTNLTAASTRLHADQRDVTSTSRLNQLHPGRPNTELSALEKAIRRIQLNSSSPQPQPHQGSPQPTGDPYAHKPLPQLPGWAASETVSSDSLPEFGSQRPLRESQGVEIHARPRSHSQQAGSGQEGTSRASRTSEAGRPQASAISPCSTPADRASFSYPEPSRSPIGRIQARSNQLSEPPASHVISSSSARYPTSSVASASSTLSNTSPVTRSNTNLNYPLASSQSAPGPPPPPLPTHRPSLSVANPPALSLQSAPLVPARSLSPYVSSASSYPSQIPTQASSSKYPYQPLDHASLPPSDVYPSFAPRASVSEHVSLPSPPTTPTSRLPMLAPDSSNYSPSQKKGGTQCSGRTLKQTRCSRHQPLPSTSSTGSPRRGSSMPKSCITPPFQSPPSISSNHTSASQNDDASIWFCHQHRKAILSEAGFFAEKGSTVWIEFNDWIPPELTDETQALLRFEMEAGLGLERHPDQAG